MTSAIRNAIAVLAATVGMTVLLAGCASKGQPTAQYDFGPLPQPQAKAGVAIGAIIMADVGGTRRAGHGTHAIPAAVFADARQSRPYAYNQWTATPFQLMTQRIKARHRAAPASRCCRPPTPPPAPRCCAWRSTTSRRTSTAPPAAAAWSTCAPRCSAITSWSTRRPSCAAARPRARTPPAARARWPTPPTPSPPTCWPGWRRLPPQ